MLINMQRGLECLVGIDLNLAIDGRTPLGDDVVFVVALRLGHMIQTHDGHR